MHDCTFLIIWGKCYIFSFEKCSDYSNLFITKVEVFWASLGLLCESINTYTDIGFGKMEAILLIHFFIGWCPQQCLPLLRQCCWKLVRELSLGLGTTFLKVWNSFPSSFNSEVSIKFEIKIHLSVWGVFLLFCCCCAELFEGLFSRLLTSDEPVAKSINEERLLSRVRH